MENNLYTTFLCKNVKQGIIAFAITLSFIFVSTDNVFAADDYLQNKKISVNKTSVLLTDFFSHMEQQSEYLFFYADADVNNIKVTVDVKDKRMDEVLDLALKGTGLSFSINGRNINIIKSAALSQNSRKITGTVIDSNNIPIIGASVLIKGTANGVITDVDGNFILNDVASDAVIVVSYVGYQTLEQVVKGKYLRVVLKEDTKLLDEIVVIGYGISKKSDITGAVASVKGDVLAKQPVGDVGTALQGRIAGVSITSQSGSPGATPTIRIRGIGTVNDSEPLYVVDGMPVSNISYLNPNDITSLEVLKDASASAIYGSRGANGVILITTKTGEVGKTIVNFNGYYGVQTAINNLNLLSGPEWYDFQMKINETRTSPIDLSKVDRNVSTDWIDEITRTAAVQNYYVDMSGGQGGLTYTASAGYFSQEGTIQGTDYERLSLRLNAANKINNIFTIGTNLSASLSTRHTILEGDEAFSIMSTALKMEPVVPVKQDDGSWGYSSYADIYNPVAAIEYTNTKRKSLDLVGSIYGLANIAKGLSFKTSFGVDIRRMDDYDFIPKYDVSPSQKTAESTVSRGNINYLNWLWENILTYDKVFKGKHDLKVMAGYTLESTRNESFSASKNGVPGSSSNLQYIDAAQNANSAIANGIAWESSMLSFLGRINYGYDDRYLATASFRVDGSSKFGKDNRFATFPSFSLAWKLSNEKFFKNLNAHWIDMIKIRGGWGQIGNQNIGNYLYQNILTSARQYQYLYGNPEEVYQGVTAISVANPNIKWETTESTNIGLDITLFKSLTLTADYYSKTTKDMLLTEPIPAHLGFESGPVTNVGSVRNRGFEFSAQWQGKLAKDLFMTVGGNIATVNNKVLSLGTGDALVGGSVYSRGNATKTQVGSAIGEFWGYKTGGLVQTEEQLAEVKKIQPNAGLGDFVFLDLDRFAADGKTLTGKSDGKLDEADKTFIGSPIPDFTYGLNISLTYKNFDFAAFFEGVYGNEIFNANRAYTYSTGTTFQKNRAVLNAWTPENRNTNIPRINGDDNNDNMRISDFYVEDGSYFRLKNIQLGYTFPKQLIQKIKIQNLRIYLSVQNLFTITDYSGADPEIGQLSSTDYLSRGFDYGTYPQSRTITGGLSLTF